MGGQGLGFASSLGCALLTNTIQQNQEYITNGYTSQRATEMVPTRPAAPEMVPLVLPR